MKWSRRKRYQLAAILIALLMAFGAVPMSAANVNAGLTAGAQTALDATLAYLANTQAPAPAFGDEWDIIALARSGFAVPAGYFEGYFESVKARLAEHGSARLSASSTDNSRLILALTALGVDARSVAGFNLLEPLADYDFVVGRGINGAIFALLAFDSKPYIIPSASSGSGQTTRENLIQYILGQELPDGAFSWMGTGGLDPDITGMALQALAPYRNRPEVSAVIARALAALSNQQEADGGFASWGSVSAENMAQVIIALTALDLSPTQNTAFVKAGGNPVTAMLRFYVSGGGFESPWSPGHTNPISTQQAVSALVAYSRFVNGYNSLYDMSDSGMILAPTGVNRNALNAAILSAESRSAANYTAASWNAMLARLAEAIAVRNNPQADQALVNAAASALNAAINALQRTGGGDPSDDTITVTFRLVGERQTTWIATQPHTFSEDRVRAYDLFVRALSGAGLSHEGASANFVTGIQAPASLGGHWLRAFDRGPNSGWMYTVNGTQPGRGIRDYILADGDAVVFFYTDDHTLGQDVLTNPDLASPEPGGGADPDPNIETVAGENAALDTLSDAETPRLDGSEASGGQDELRRSPYIDVHEDDWFYGAVIYMRERGLMVGVGEGKFAPDAPFTRAMLPMVMHNNAGRPTVTGGMAFADVEAGKWYSEAIEWASAAEIVAGYGNGFFGPSDPLTREQFVTFLYRYANQNGLDISASANLNVFDDSGTVSDWALSAVRWAVSEGLIVGRTPDSLAPQGIASRAEAAELLMRFFETPSR